MDLNLVLGSIVNDRKDRMTFTTDELGDYDVCVSCGNQTSFKKTDHITFRYGYIEGAGQLCFKCAQIRKMHKQGNYDVESSHS